MTPVFRAPPEKPGYSPIFTEEATSDLGMDFGIHRMSKGLFFEEVHAKESAWILLNGEARLKFAEQTALIKRTSLFDERPTVLHLGPHTGVAIEAVTEVEWARVRTSNTARFPAKLFAPEEVSVELRGHDLVQGACRRQVLSVFDKKNRPESNLVIGEVVNLPGRWSSYPPHHHSQPEIYYYRFTLPQGYGHAEVGEDVFKVRSGDTLSIPGGLDHGQVSAPGYGMYYLWAVRHLENDPYTGFEFTEEHRWILDPKNQGWAPQ